MSMTQQDFKAIADSVAEVKRRVALSDHDDSEAMMVLSLVTRELATACFRQYRGGYGFNRDRFVEACGFPKA